MFAAVHCLHIQARFAPDIDETHAEIASGSWRGLRVFAAVGRTSAEFPPAWRIGEGQNIFKGQYESRTAE